MVLVENLHFYLRGSGLEPMMLHFRGAEVAAGVLLTRERRGHADIPTQCGIQFDSALYLRECSWIRIRIGQEDPYHQLSTGLGNVQYGQ